MKVDLSVFTYPLDPPLVMYVSATHGEAGSPIVGIGAGNFKLTVVRGPGGWKISENLKIQQLTEVVPGVYVFPVKRQDGSDLLTGYYTIVVAVTGSVGFAGPLYGQTLVRTSLPA